MIRAALIVAGLGAPARAEDVAITTSAEPTTAPVDLRLTLSSFWFREAGADAAPLVASGATVPSASPVTRFFGDMRVELTDGVFQLDARVRQTTSGRFQSGAAGGGEYDIRTLKLRAGSETTSLYVGRQYVDAVGATKIDGVVVDTRLSPGWTATLFGGAFPQLGSRSVATDYPEIEQPGGMLGSALIPIAGGAGSSYAHDKVNGSFGVGAVRVVQEVQDASERSRVFVTANGYARPFSGLDVYHFALIDVAGAGVGLTNGSLGINARPTDNLELAGSFHHVSSDLLEIAARNTLSDPDPTALGIVQNDTAVVRVSQDQARAGASLALAQSRFQLSASAGLRRRPRVDVQLADGSGMFSFPSVESADVTLSVLDRRSVADLRLSATAIFIYPIGDDVPNRSAGSTARVVAGRAFADSKLEIEVDGAAQRYQDVHADGACTSSLDPSSCFGRATVSAAQLGALASWQLGREWLVIVDAHAGVRQMTAASIMGKVDYPTVYSLTTFARVQWRYR
ncbi:MAG: hypothetical protein M3619_06130 [Myxococcota bacterium]|nr:hypothetical protein [Myxococcota bacterium]